MDLANIGVASMRVETYEWNQMARTNWRLKAAEKVGRMRTRLGVANAIDGLGDSRVPDSYVTAVLLAAGATDELAHDGFRALAIQKASMSRNPFGFGPLQKAVAAARAVDNHVDEDAQMAFAAQAVVAADNFKRHASEPPNPAAVDHDFVRTVRQHWDSESALRAAITPDQWNNIGRDTRWSIGNELAVEHQAAARAYFNKTDDQNRKRLQESTRRISNLDHLEPDAGVDPWDP